MEGMAGNAHTEKTPNRGQAVPVTLDPAGPLTAVHSVQNEHPQPNLGDHQPGDHRNGAAEPNDDLDEHEGGLRAWLAILGSFLVYFSTFGVVNSFGFFQTFYQLDYLSNYSSSTISFIGTLQITLMYLSGSVAGALFDSYGLKYLYPIAAIGGAGSLLLTSFTQPHQIWQLFLSQSLLFGLTVAYGVQPALTIAGQYFRRRRALAMGIVASGSSVGGVTIPIMFSKLIPLIGFPWAMRVGALLLMCCYAVAMTVSRVKTPPRKMQSWGELLDFRGYRDIRYACLSAGAVVASLGVYVPFYYIEPYCRALDPDSAVGPYLLPLINASSLFGRIAGGYAADLIGHINVLYPMISLSGIFCLAMWLVASQPGVLVGFALLYGFCSGVFISVMPAATAQIGPPEKMGARLGAFGAVTSVAILSGTPLAGALVRNESEDGYRMLIVFAGCCLVGGGGIMFVARLLHDRSLRSKW